MKPHRRLPRASCKPKLAGPGHVEIEPVRRPWWSSAPMWPTKTIRHHE